MESVIRLGGPNGHGGSSGRLRSESISLVKKKFSLRNKLSRGSSSLNEEIPPALQSYFSQPKSESKAKDEESHKGLKCFKS